MGFRAGQDFARYLGWQVRQVRSDVITLPRDGETLAESLAAIGPRDCVIVFALCRPPRMLGHLIDKLAQSGGATALIGTGGARAPAGALVVIEPIHDTLDEIRATGHAGAGTTATVRIGSREAEGHPNAKLDDQEIKRADLSRDLNDLTSCRALPHPTATRAAVNLP